MRAACGVSIRSANTHLLPATHAAARQARHAWPQRARLHVDDGDVRRHAGVIRRDERIERFLAVVCGLNRKAALL